MTQQDENNIEYVLSLDPSQVSVWISSMTEDEFQYALSIIECAHWKLLDEAVEYESDCSKAKKVLEKIFQ